LTIGIVSDTGKTVGIERGTEGGVGVGEREKEKEH
jgi:hypothetical protein